MTALARYAKLEAEARYFDGESAQPRWVIISFGERSLTIMSVDGTAIAHWPLASLRALGRRKDSSVQLVPERDSDERLVLADREMLDAIMAVCPNLFHRPVGRRNLRRALLWSGGALASLAVIVFVLVPVLASQLAHMIPPEREQQFGDAVAGQLQSILSLMSGGTAPAYCDVPSGVAALEQMTDRLMPEPNLPYPLRISVIDFPMVNAVALPGGRIVLFRGLIETADSPEEVAGVLAHEIGHVVHFDPTREALRAAGSAGILGLLLGDVFGASIVVVTSKWLLDASYQREAEAKADEVAYQLLGDAELPTRPFVEFFDKMRETYGDTPEALKLLASHPGLEERAKRAAAADRIGDAPYEPVLSDRDWVALSGICTDGLPRVRSPGSGKR
ncbi:MAG TPA: M48 family metallopeptidase [Thermohalobaculum sp.]|nr:M48 family metallopeptidase [Thermohalobaculum sp.]